MLECVYERVVRARLIDRVIIATDDPRIEQAARSFGARVEMTRADHSTGTERVAEVAAREDAEIVANVQGDEPLIDPAAIDLAIAPLLESKATLMSTLKKQITDFRDLHDPNVVKVVTDRAGNAIYFSRSLIPFARGAAAAEGAGDLLHAGPAYFKHLGIYVYRRHFLLQYPQLPPGPLEQAEKLEQLRALENGCPIRVVETDYEAIGVDTPEDLERVRELVLTERRNG
jgi:3-deoxy-manno-octulosonate cytidylyltransferase (CMP-KDO synthetase)